MPPAAIVPDKHSRFIIVENSHACLHLRTRAYAWWLGGAAMLVQVGIVGGCLFLAAQHVLTRHWLAAVVVLAQMVGGCGFLTIFLLGLACEHLRVADGEIAYGWNVGKFALTRKRAALSEITKLSSDSNEGAYYMVIKTAQWEANFGSSESGALTIDAICGEIERRRGAAV